MWVSGRLTDFSYGFTALELPFSGYETPRPGMDSNCVLVARLGFQAAKSSPKTWTQIVSSPPLCVSWAATMPHPTRTQFESSSLACFCNLQKCHPGRGLKLRPRRYVSGSIRKTHIYIYMYVLSKVVFCLNFC